MSVPELGKFALYYVIMLALVFLLFRQQSINPNRSPGSCRSCPSDLLTIDHLDVKSLLNTLDTESLPWSQRPRHTCSGTAHHGLVVALGDLAITVTKRSPPRRLFPHLGLRRRALPLPSFPRTSIRSPASYRLSIDQVER